VSVTSEKAMRALSRASAAEVEESADASPGENEASPHPAAHERREKASTRLQTGRRFRETKKHH
jgi:hypothetical protein